MKIIRRLIINIAIICVLITNPVLVLAKSINVQQPVNMNIIKNDIDNIDEINKTIIKSFNSITKTFDDNDIELLKNECTINQLIDYSELAYKAKKLRIQRDKEEEERRRIEAEEAEEAARRAYEASKRDDVYYNPYNMMDKSNLRVSAVQRILNGTRFDFLSQVLVDLEDRYGVNLVYVVSIMALESGWGKSSRANNGSNNITGHSVYGDDSPGTQFSSWEACVEETFRLLSQDYLNPNGVYYRGTSVWNVGVTYCVSADWADKINGIANELASK